MTINGPGGCGLLLHGVLHRLGVADFGLGVDQAQNSFGRCLSHLHFGEPAAQLFDRIEEVARVGHECNQSTGTDHAAEQIRATDGERKARGKACQSEHDRHVDGGLSLILHRRAVHGTGEPAKFSEVFLLTHECFARLHTHDGLVIGGGDLRVGAPYLPRTTQNAALKAAGHPGEQGQDQQHGDREFRRS